MYSLVASLILGSLISVYADQPFILRDCGSKDNALAELKSAKVSPDPIRIPGDLTATGEAQLYRDLANTSLNLEVHIERYLGFLWITVPCISDVGSCTYDLCDLMANVKGDCPPQLKEDNIPCTCDTLTSGTYSLNSRKFSIPKLSGLWSWLATGDYKVDMKLVDKATGSEVGCIHGEATFVDGDECSGFLCSIFG